MKHSISALALAAVLSASSALAADLPSRKAPPAYIPPPVMTWTGFYAGLNLGGAWQENNGGGNWWWGGNNGGSRGGVVGGGQIGYNYQITPMFLVGLEADIQGTSMGGGNNGNNAWVWALANPGAPFWGWGNNGGSRVGWFGTVRGRAGLVLWDSKLLVYGTGGLAYSNRAGWTVGGGAEYMFAPNWSVKAEYLYTDLSGGGNGGNWGWGWGGNRRTKFHTVRAGVNYHFNWGSAPILAKY